MTDRQGPVIIPVRQAETRHPARGTSEAGRDPHLLGHQPGHQGEKGISQGDLLHTKVETSASRMHGNHKEQNGSHSLNRWKERLALQHRHAGMSTGSEPYTLRGILSKGPRALMTRLGPSHERGPGAQPHIGRTPNKIVSEFSVRIYITYSDSIDQRTMTVVQFIQSSFQFVYITYSNATIREDKSMIGAVAQCYQYNVFYQGDNLPLL